MSKNLILFAAAAALAVSPIAPVAPAYAQGGNPLNSIFGCQSGGNKQATGAIVGALLGGALSNTTASKRTRGRNTVLGAAAGAAAGSYIGCRMQVSDQRRAEDTTRQALDSGQNASWNNPETGASGRVTMISSRAYDDSASEPASLEGVRFARGVEPQGPYFGARGRYSASGRVRLHGRPDNDSRVVGQMEPGETFEALARVRAYPNDWLLAGRDGVAIGYVSESAVERQQRTYSSDGGRGRGQMCRTFDQSITAGNGETQTNRYTACQTASGEWVVQG